jgi:hypothetical protein
LQPDLPEGLYSGEVTEIRRARGSPHTVQELIAVCPDLMGERFALAHLLG